jgi:hypothetical protein
MHNPGGAALPASVPDGVGFPERETERTRAAGRDQGLSESSMIHVHEAVTDRAAPISPPPRPSGLGWARIPTVAWTSRSMVNGNWLTLG